MAAGTSAEYRFDRFRLRPGERQLLEGERAVKLGARAFDTLVVLVQERDRAVPVSLEVRDPRPLDRDQIGRAHV